jgi:hypothetical protein
MALIVAVLGAITALLCATLLLRAWLGSRQRLLLWAGLCFVALTLSNGLLVVDLVDAALDLHRLRLAIAAGGMLLLVYGLVWETDPR